MGSLEVIQLYMHFYSTKRAIGPCQTIIMQSKVPLIVIGYRVTQIIVIRLPKLL